MNSAMVIGSFTLSVILTWLVRAYALKRHLLDHPNQRSSHTEPTPRGGGLSIVISFLAAVSILYVNDQVDRTLFAALTGGGILVSLFGFWDDHGHIPALWRFAAHLAAAAWAIWWLGGLGQLHVAGVSLNFGWLGQLFALLAIVWLVNLYNFMDGIDGIAGIEGAGVSIIAGILALGVHTSTSPVVFFVLAAAVLGFLLWNWPPARIFMGDVGSGFVGYVFGVLLLAEARDSILPSIPIVILLGVFLVDATVTLLRRVVRGDRWYAPHRMHAYQHAASRWGHRPVTLAVLTINVFWLTPFAVASVITPGWCIVFAFAALLPLAVVFPLLGAGCPHSRLNRRNQLAQVPSTPNPQCAEEAPPDRHNSLPDS